MDFNSEEYHAKLAREQRKLYRDEYDEVNVETKAPRYTHEFVGKNKENMKITDNCCAKGVSTTYYVNEKNRTVTCVIEEDGKNINRIVVSRMMVNNCRVYDKFVVDYLPLNIMYKFVGTAKCGKKDKFDINIGMEVALYKALCYRTGAINGKIKEAIAYNNKINEHVLKYGLMKRPKRPSCMVQEYKYPN